MGAPGSPINANASWQSALLVAISLIAVQGRGAFAASAPVPARFALCSGCLFGSFPTNTQPRVFVADVNKDGLPDAVVARDTNGFSVLYGTGYGSFAPPRSYPTPATVIAPADFNRDGNPDLAVSYQYNTFILFGDNQGKFTESPNLGIAAGWPQHVQAADLNNDGNLDLVLGTVYCLGCGDGAFEEAHYFSGSAVFRVADVNSDSWSDLLCAVYAGSALNSFFVCTNDGYAQFRNHQYFGTNEPQNHPSLEVDDLNGDLKPDVLVLNANPSINSISVWYNKGDGTFTLTNTYQLDFTAKQVATADFNLDGLKDAVVGGGSVARILYGRSDGTFVTGERFPMPGSFAVGDFDRNGMPDIIYVDANAATVIVLLNQVALSIELVGGVCQVSWSNVPGYTLQFKEELSPANTWQTVTNTPVLTAGRLQVADPAGFCTRFYRLKGVEL